MYAGWGLRLILHLSLCVCPILLGSRCCCTTLFSWEWRRSDSLNTKAHDLFGVPVEGAVGEGVLMSTIAQLEQCINDSEGRAYHKIGGTCFGAKQM